MSHRIVWTLAPEYLSANLICNDNRDDCHWYCAVGCEDYCTGYDDGTEHPKKHSKTCNPIEWIENGDGAIEHYTGPVRSPIDGLIAFEWDGDTYLWRYADDAPEPPTVPVVDQMVLPLGGV